MVKLHPLVSLFPMWFVNGLRAWFITHTLFILFSDIGLGYYPASIVHDNWGGLLIASNVYGYILTAFCWFKAHYFPSHPADRKFSGDWIFDLYMGIEFNPRFGKLFDFKLFHNGRPGIVAWTLINFSFAAAQYSKIGYVTNSMLLDWYLRTIDIAHDHFGFYLSWGDTVWLPFMYTFQTHFLVRNQIDLSWSYFTLVLAIGMGGYYIFRTVNNQKDLARSSNGNCKIWGKPARVIRTEFVTTDGKVHKSLLLTSGYWGLSRHFNYVGDLMISLAMCLPTGFGYISPYFYIIYMTILLVHRIERDHDRCTHKYGKYWDEYCKQVPAKLIPYFPQSKLNQSL
ncbi:7-dehydrocholesterol reductase [Nowakowskiella sp. JEL0078]|nr:7-dehydrocholesterol reductase [Nowakowskiella sp. JEL0078]